MMHNSLAHEDYCGKSLENGSMFKNEYVVNIIFLFLMILFFFLHKFFVFENEIKEGGLMSSHNGIFSSFSYVIISLFTVISTIMIESLPTVMCITHTLLFFFLTVVVIFFPPLVISWGNALLAAMFAGSAGGGVVGCVLPALHFIAPDEAGNSFVGDILSWFSFFLFPILFASVGGYVSHKLFIRRWLIIPFGRDGDAGQDGEASCTDNEVIGKRKDRFNLTTVSGKEGDSGGGGGGGGGGGRGEGGGGGGATKTNSKVVVVDNVITKKEKSKKKKKSK
jgi:uncharacterized membrane protein YgcG